MGNEVPQFRQSFCRIEDFGIKTVFPCEIAAGWVLAHGPQFRDIGRMVCIGLDKALGQ